MLAKDGCTAESIIVSMFILVIVIVFLFKKKMNRALAWVKNSKVMSQLPAIYLFSWEREGNPYTSNPIKSFKILQVRLLTNPYNALV